MYTTTLVHALALHYDTSSSKLIYSTTRMCVPEAQGTCDVLPIAQVFPGSNAVTHLRLNALIIGALIAERRFLPCQGVTLIT